MITYHIAKSKDFTYAALMQLEPVIGLEIHVQLKTKSKMFCACPNIFGDVEPNTAICPICMGYPGTLPVPNATAIEWTQRAGAALGCQLALKSKFDRKHYFYPDLPKGYQISQYDQPFCGEGVFEVVVDGNTKKVGIERIHLEEDAAKNTHPKEADHTLVDYNRAGTPLMEIVTKPDLRSPGEAKIFLQELQRIMRTLDISDADMEKGQMRCDANISLREQGSSELHPKTEIKNVNSFRFVEKALEYEIERQTKEWEKGSPPNVQSTRGYNSDKGTTYGQRGKEAAADYRYFPEPDIPPFEFTAEELGQVRGTVSELPLAKQTRFMDEFGLSDHHAQLFVNNQELGEFFENTVSELKQLDKEQDDITTPELPKLVQHAANMTLRYVRHLIEQEKLAVSDLQVTPANFAELVVMVSKGRINKGAVDDVLTEMQKTGGDPDHIVQNLALEQVSGGEELATAIAEVIVENPDVVDKIKSGKEEAIQFLVGQVMRKTKGKAAPDIVKQRLQEKIQQN